MRKLYLLVILTVIFQGTSTFGQKRFSEFENKARIKTFLLEFIDHADFYSGNTSGRMAATRNPQDSLVLPFLGYFGINQLNPPGDQGLEATILNFMDETIQNEIDKLTQEYSNKPDLFEKIMELDNVMITPYEYWRLFWHEDEDDRQPRINSRIWLIDNEIAPLEIEYRKEGNRFQRPIDCIIHRTARFTDYSVIPPRVGRRADKDLETRIYVSYTKRKGQISNLQIDKITYRPSLKDTVPPPQFMARIEIAALTGIPSELINIGSLDGAKSEGASTLGMNLRFLIRNFTIDKTSAKMSFFSGVGFQNSRITNSISVSGLNSNIPVNQVDFKPEGGALKEFILNTSIKGVQQQQSINILMIPIGLQVEKPLKSKHNISLNGSFGINGIMVISDSYEVLESGTVTYSGQATYLTPSGKEVSIMLENIDLEVNSIILKEYNLRPSSHKTSISKFGSNLFFDLGTTIYNKYETLGMRISAGINYTLTPLGIEQIDIQDIVYQDEMRNLTSLSKQMLFNDFHVLIGLVMNLTRNLENY